MTKGPFAKPIEMEKKELELITGTQWIHSHEEDHGNELVFRRAGYSFPPSRGRRAFELQPDGVLAGSRPGPTDRRHAQGGHWTLNEDRLTLDAGDPGAEVLVVKKIEPDRLVLERPK